MNKFIIFILMLLFSVSIVNSTTIFEGNESGLWSITGGNCNAVDGFLSCSTTGTTWGANGIQSTTFDYTQSTNLTLEFQVDSDGCAGSQSTFGFGDGVGVSYTNGEFIWYCQALNSFSIFEDGGAVGTALTSITGLVDLQIVIFNGGTAKYYYKAAASSTWILHYTSLKSPSDTSMRALYAHKVGDTAWYDIILYNESNKGGEPTPLFPAISIDDIGLVNNSYHNSDFDIQLNLSVVDTNENVNSTYSLKSTFNNPTYDNTIISYSSIIPLYEDTTGTTRNQFCIENGFDNAFSYTTTSNSSTAKYYSGGWFDTTLNNLKYDSITCEKEVQFGINTLQPNGTINVLETITTPTKDALGLNADSYLAFTPDKTAEQYCQENYNNSFLSYDIGTNNIPFPTRNAYNGSVWSSALSGSFISNLECIILNDAIYDITFSVENNETQTNSSQYTFTIDTISPVTDATNLEIYTYIFSGTLFSCTDTNLNFCNITINNQIGDISTLFNLTENGNLTYNIYAEDLAGNELNYSNVLFVNPYQYLRFNDSIRDLYTQNYSYGSFSPTDEYIIFKLFDLGLGDHNLLFSKDGYIDSYHNFTLNSSSLLNETYQVEPSNLFFTLKDFSTSNTISDWQLIIKQNSSILSTQNVSSTFQLLYNETYKDDLEFIFQKTGYNPSYYFIDFSSGSTATETIYLLNSSSDVLMPIIIKDLLATNYIEGASVNLYGIKENEEYFIDEQITDYAGKVYFTLNDNFLYKVIVSKDGYVTTNYKISTTEASYTFLIPESSTTLDYVFAGFSYSLDLYELDNITYARARYTDEDSLINKVTLNYLTDTNYSLTSSTDTLLIPLNDSLKSYTLHLEVIRDSVTYDFYKTFANEDLLYNSSSSLSATEYVPDQEDKTLISIFILMASIIVGFFMFGQVGGYLGSVMALLSLWYLGLMSVYIAMPLLLFTLLMFGFFRGGDY